MSTQSIGLDGVDPAEDKQVLGRKIWRVMPYIKRYWRRATVGIGTNAAARAFDLLPFVAMGLAVDFYESGNLTGPAFFIDLIEPNPALGYGVLIFACFAMLAVFQGTSDFAWQSLAYNVQHDLRMDATRNLIRMEASYYDIRQTGALMSVVSSDVNQLEDVISDSSTSIIRLVVTFTAAFFILLWMSWKLVFVLFAPVVFMIPLVYWFSTRVQGKYRKQRESTGEINAVLENVISGISVVQAYNAQEYEVQRVMRESGNYRDQAIAASADRNRFVPAVYGIAGLAFGLLVSAGGYLTAEGDITVGQFVTFMLISTRMTFPLFIFGRLLNELQRGEAASRRVFAMIDLEPSIVDREDAQSLDGEIHSVEFRDVYFTYPQTDAAVLNGISFKVDQGGFIGVMGHTGAGKSTILKLLLRFYEADRGQILINGSDIHSLKLESIRSQIGSVSQDPFLFFGSIRENVKYARDATEEEVDAALRMAGAWEFVQLQQDGAETLVGDRGVKLSGGQKARVSLARALLKQPSLLVLDEASSALDAETERRIQENLFSTGQQRTTVAVAHRLSTIRKADEILALVDGVVVERGKHSQLVEANGVYASQWRIQTGEPEEE